MCNKSKEENKKIVAVDFFCGLGGVSAGFIKSGIKVIAGIDNNERLKNIYERNNKGAIFYPIDIETDKSKIIALLRSILPKNHKNEKSVFVACAPCQPFSLHNKQYKKDPRKSLMEAFVEIVENLGNYKPDAIFIENVGTMKKRGEEILENIIQKLENMGYRLVGDAPKVHNAAHFGIPQSRKRLIVVAVKKRLLNKKMSSWNYFENKYKEEELTVKKAFERYENIKGQILESFSANDERIPKDPLHITQTLSEDNYCKLQKITETGGTRRDYWENSDMLECHKKHSGHIDVYSRMSWDIPSPTLTCRCISISNGRFGHPDPAQVRAISLREAAIIQTLEDYEFVNENGNIVKTEIAQYIGNAVPPKLAKKFGEYLQEILIKTNKIKKEE